MKKLILSLLVLVFASGQLAALDASVSFATFKSPNKNYIEVYLHLVGKTVTFVPTADSLQQAAVEIIMLLRKDGKIVQFDKYKLNSPKAEMPLNFIDLKRFALENGEHELEVSIQDMNDEGNAKSYKKVVNLAYSESKLCQSDIQMLASFEPSEEENMFIKNGFYLEPLPFNYYNKYASKLIFYNELYGADRFIADDFVIRYSVERLNGKGEAESVMVGNKRRKPKAVNVILLQMDISRLESGNYNLNVEVRNRQQELLSKKTVFFQRSNPYLQMELIASAEIEEEFVSQLNEEELKYSLRAIAMNVPDEDVEVLNLILAEKDTEAQRRYLFRYWASYNPNDPAGTHEKYMNVAKAVDKTYYSGFGYGFESDRGWMFMKYGKPHDVVTVENEPSAPPYEIWVYNDLPRTRQRNVRFLFFNPSLAKGNYQLLHSTVRGEINNPNWEEDLYRDAPQDYRNGSANGFEVNRRAREYFSDF
ncbi:MAG: GWxTD domain-containing protein [Bacteroidota bacterium]